MTSLTPLQAMNEFRAAFRDFKKQAGLADRDDIIWIRSFIQHRVETLRTCFCHFKEADQKAGVLPEGAGPLRCAYSCRRYSVCRVERRIKIYGLRHRGLFHGGKFKNSGTGLVGFSHENNLTENGG